MLFSLGAQHDAASVGYAVIEGVAFGLHDGWTGMQPATADASPASALSLMGGGARSALWAGLIAPTLVVPLVTYKGGQAGGALGAARLARLCVGGDMASVCIGPPVLDCLEPQALQAGLLDPRHARFGRLYPALCAQRSEPQGSPQR